MTIWRGLYERVLIDVEFNAHNRSEVTVTSDSYTGRFIMERLLKA